MDFPAGRRSSCPRPSGPTRPMVCSNAQAAASPCGCGRSRAKAAAFCASLPGGAESQPLAFDRDGDVETQIAHIAPDLIVDATGPFQSYGDDPYRVVQACLALGISYLDLADGAAYVQG